jgi:UPF0755 protein
MYRPYLTTQLDSGSDSAHTLSMHIERHTPRRRGTGRAALKFLLLGIVLGSLIIAGWVITITLGSTPALVDLGSPGPDLNPLEQVALQVYLSLYRDALFTPVSAESAPVEFRVEPGEDAGTVAARLAAQGLVRDAELLRLYLRYKGLDDDIEAGSFVLHAAMNIPTVAQALSDAAPDAVRFRLWEGWRVEQIVDSLAQQPHLAFSRDEFARLTGPGGRGAGAYSFLADLPAAASLEGFLFPDTYQFDIGTPTGEIVDRLLKEFDRQVTAQMRADLRSQDLNLYQAITLASIVEREAVHDEERAIIASVFLNRLEIGMNLGADPTTQYAIGTPGNWWPQLTLDPRTVDHPYNTYVHDGLPPGPIASPGLASIRAVIYPAQTPYYYFQARCDGSKLHNFAVTYEEHVANGCP